MSKYEQSSEAEKKMLYDKICPAVFHCVALLRHWERNRGPSDDEAYIPDDGGGGVAGGDDDETYVPDASDEDDDWAYNLSAEDVSDLEVDEVREALEERGLDVEGDDALVRARLVQAITREQRLVKLEVREVAIVPGGSDLKFLAEEVSDLEVVEVREKLEDRGLDVEGDDATVRARLVQAIEEEDLFVFNNTVEGPRAPAVKPGRRKGLGSVSKKGVSMTGPDPSLFSEAEGGWEELGTRVAAPAGEYMEV